MCKNKVLALQLVPYLCVFYCDVVELGSYGKLKYYDTMTEEGKNDFRIVCIGFLLFLVSVCLPIFFKSHFLPLCMTSVTLCELLFLRFRLVFAIVFIWNWRCAIPWVIMLFHSKDPIHCDCGTHSEKWCRQRKHSHTLIASALLPPHAHDNVEKHVPPTLLWQCALNFREESMSWWYSDLCKGINDLK